jgi:predicted esterase
MAFSQGAFVAATLGVAFPSLFCKVILQCGWANEGALRAALAPQQSSVKYLLQHGTRDMKVPIARARRLHAFLRRNALDARLQEYDCGHEYTDAILGDANRFLGGM